MPERGRCVRARAALAASLALLTAGAIAGVGATACSEPPKLVGEGATCAVTTDCALGLVCVPRQKGGRTCTGDVTSISHATPPPTDAGDAGGDADGSRDGSPDGASEPSDGSPDGEPADTSAPPVDAAAD
jgi:hypothetical protein